MAQPIFQVDAFAEAPFAGNPAAVCPMDEAADETWMARVANEMNLSETAFLHPEGEGYRLRWFTPAAEVDLCGHATLASAHVLWEQGLLEANAPARFNTRSGELVCRQVEAGIEMDFPAVPAAPVAPGEVPPDLEPGLRTRPLRIERNAMDYLVELATEAEVHALAPDFTALGRVETRGVIVTAPAEEGKSYHFVSRFFAPAHGIPEDPVTGSAHCCLGPYWGARLGLERMTARQVSPRGGTVGIVLDGDRVRLSGRAVTVLRGELV